MWPINLSSRTPLGCERKQDHSLPSVAKPAGEHANSLHLGPEIMCMYRYIEKEHGQVHSYNRFTGIYTKRREVGLAQMGLVCG